MTPGTSGLKPSPGLLPPLENGDQLSRCEFERRYAADPCIRKAELIEGVVYLASPLRFIPHAQPHGNLSTWIGTYAALTPGTAYGIEPTVRLDRDTELQPDIVLIRGEDNGGQTQFSPEGYLEGGPELVIEISASSASIDINCKKQIYCRNGVQEYLVWRWFEGKLDWFYLVDGDYRSLSPDPDRILRSQVFPGLWLPTQDLLDNQMGRVLQTLQQGLDSPEHQAFVTQLESSG